MSRAADFIRPPHERAPKAEKRSAVVAVYIAFVLGLAVTALGCTAFHFFV